MTHEYLRAVETYGLSYADLKRMARASLEHSFIPGDSLWSDGRALRRAAVCAEDRAAGDRVSEKCEKLIGASERAGVQWQLEKAFAEFEREF
jgi:adenosine deaminase/adenosine deaminase CECR1